MERDHEQIKHLKYILGHIKSLREGRCRRDTCKFQHTICPVERFAKKLQTWETSGLPENGMMVNCQYRSRYRTEQSTLNLNNTIEEVEKMILIEMI